MKIPGDWNSQAEKLQLYEGTVWLRQKFNATPKEGKKYLLYFVKGVADRTAMSLVTRAFPEPVRLP